MLTAWNALPMLDRLLDDVSNGVAETALGNVRAHSAYSSAIDVRANADEMYPSGQGCPRT